MALAIVNAAGKVVTFVRDDVPAAWAPPDGCTAIPSHELPAGWERAADTDAAPQSVSARQIRLWLVAHGKTMASVDAAIDSIEDQRTRDMVRVEWEYAPYIDKSHPMLAPMAESLGMTLADVESAFREAAKL